MRTILKRALGGLAVITATTAMALSGTGAAQAASIVCPINGSGTIDHCQYVPGKKALVATATSVNASPEPATLGKTITVTGKVTNLLSGANGTMSSTANIYFIRYGTTASAYMGKATVSASGGFARSFPAKYSGTWWAKYNGKASTTSTNGRLSSKSNKDYVEVRTVGTKTVVVGTTSRAMLTYQTAYRSMDTSKSVRVAYTLRCTAPAGSVDISTVGGNGTGVADTATINTGATVFSGAVYLNVDDVATAIRVENTAGVPCSVSVTGTQQRVTVIH